MKQYLQKSIFTRSIYFIIFFAILLVSESRAQQVMTDNNGIEHIKFELDGYNYFSRMMIVHEFSQLKEVKVALSDEEGIIYLYPLEKDIKQLSLQVDEILRAILAKDAEYDKDQETRVILELKDFHGDWIESYALSGSRTTENDSCHVSFPFCTNSSYTFPAGVNTSAQVGPNYNCLNSQPNPAWYHLKILDPGSITIFMQSSPSRDIDYCLWGPFTDPITPCPMNNSNGGLTGGKVVSCSYSANHSENAIIPNGQTGEYYILIITNYSNNPCNITFQKTGGAGTTDCTILPPPATSNSPVCVGETLQLNAALVGGATYHWTGPAGYSSNVQNPQVQNIQHNNAGTYFLTITVDGQTSDPTTTEVAVVDPPVGTLALAGSAAICKGDSTQLIVTATGPGPYSAAIGSGSGMPVIIDFSQSPHTFWVKPQSSTLYTLNSVSNIGCSGTVSGQADVTVRPLPQPAFTTTPLCSGKQITFTDQSSIASGTIGSWVWDFGDGSNTANTQNPVHVYANAGNYTVGLQVSSNAGCSASITESITISPTPQVNAGSDKTIPFGTNTQLDGTASGGSGSHTYQWTPANKVDNPGVLTPNTTNLEESTNFTLTATDAGNGCQKSDVMTVTVTGGALAAIIEASLNEICIGGSTLLTSTVGGGSGNYTYTWTSEPPGYSSSLPNITVQPVVNTTYKLKVYDGFNSLNAEKQVVVHSLPVIAINPVEPVLHGTTTLLKSNVTSGAQPFAYLWEPASKVEQPTASETETVNLYQSQSFTLKVTDNNGCLSSTQTDVTITGTELEVNPITDNPVICLRDTAVLRAVPGGGSNSYVSFIWEGSDGFYSTEVAPHVSPIETTLYTVVVDDGFNTADGQVTVTVLPLPEIDLIPHNDPRVQDLGNDKIGICVYDTITLDAGNPGQEYLWNNGSTEQTIKISTSGLSFDEQHYQVRVTNIETGCSEDAEITAFFTFQNCSYGIEKQLLDNRMNIYPNPSRSGLFTVALTGLRGEKQLQVYSLVGKTLYSQTFSLPSDGRQEISIDLSAFAPGVYFLKLSGEREVIHRPMIVSE